MPDLAVAHRAVGQAYVLSIGVDKTVGIVGHEHIIHGRISAFGRVVFIFGYVRVVAPAVSYY